MVRQKENWVMQQSGLIRALLVTLLLLGSMLADAAPVQVQVKPEQPRVDEAFQLVFSASEKTDGTPDFSPLDQDFEILSQRQSSQSSWVNGKSSQSINWILNVMARRAGRLSVPEIEFGRDRSVAIEIEVQKEEASGGARPDLFLEVAVDSKTPYLQTQVIYTWRIYYRVNLSGANMGEPVLENALVMQLGENRRYRKQLDGVDYQVIEGRYAIFPQQAGKLTIPPLALTAEVLGAQQQADMNRFFSFQRTTTRRIKSKALSLQVQGVPDVFGPGPWLAASQLELSQSWSDESLQIKVGEPLTRTLTLRAVGVPKSQLPDIGMDLNDANLKTYPEQPLTSERTFENGLSSVREQKVAIIAASAGRYRLPAISLRWYNTQTGKVEITTLPEVMLTAVAAPDMLTTASPDSGLNSPEVTMQPGVSVKGSGKSEFPWKWITLLLAIGWSLSLIWFWYRCREKNFTREGKSTATPQHKPDLRKFVRRLKLACVDHDAQQAGQILREWGMASFGVANLMDVATRCPVALQQQIIRLNQSLYSGEEQDWDPLALLQAFTAQQDQHTASASVAKPLRPLYPELD